MKLATAANYFTRTPIAGWNGSKWVCHLTTASLIPYDRFISDREFGLKRRMLLIRPEDTTFDDYSVIRFPNNEIYMVGMHDSDMQMDEYSRTLLIHRAQYQVEMFQFNTVTKASGMPGNMTRASLGLYWGDAERVRSSKSKEFDHVSFTQSTLTLPRDCPIDTNNEISAGGKFYTIEESYMASGFRQCRAMAKRSS